MAEGSPRGHSTPSAPQSQASWLVLLRRCFPPALVLTLSIGVVASGPTSVALSVAAARPRTQEASAAPVRVLPGQFRATGNVANPSCNDGRGVEVRIAAPVSPTTAYTTASTTLSSGESVVTVGPVASPGHLVTEVFAFGAGCSIWRRLGDNGRAVLAVPYESTVELLAPSAGGEILLGAVTSSGKVLLGLLRADGTLDRRFGDGGWSRLPWPGYPTAIDQEPSGRILLGDTDSGGCCGYNWVGALTRYGAVEKGFGKNGLVVVPRTLEDVEISRLAVEPDGDILALTSGGHMGAWDSYPTAFSPKGVLLTGFQRRFEQALRRLGPPVIFIGDLLIRPGGFLLLGTEQRNAVSSVPDPTAMGRLAVLESDGSLDTTFGEGGRTLFASPLQQQVVAVPAPFGGELMVGTDPVVQEPDTAIHQLLRIVALTGSGRVNQLYGLRGRSLVDLPYGPLDDTTMISNSSSGVVVVGNLENANFELDEFRL